MLKNVRTVLVVLLILSAVAATGYFFAKKKSEPVYQSKIDRVMFERKNKTPGFIMRLPDKEEISKPSQQETQKEPAKETPPQAIEANELLDKIPLVAKLAKNSVQEPLEHINADKNLIEEKDGIYLPKIGKNGEKAWIEYGKTEEVQPNFYRVSVIINGLGLDSTVTTAAIESLPANVSLSFSPYATDLDKQIKTARSMGHETYVDLLLSSKDFLKSDTGPLAMSMTASFKENLRRLKKSLNINAPVGGLIFQRGIVDFDNPQRMKDLFKEIDNMGLLAVDATGEDYMEKISSTGLPRKKAEIVIDSYFVREEIDRRLAAAEELAQKNGSVLVVVNPKPVALHAVNDWIASFSPQISDYQELKNTVIEKPLALVPVSNVVVEE